jgi:hypothetical protein
MSASTTPTPAVSIVSGPVNTGPERLHRRWRWAVWAGVHGQNMDRGRRWRTSRPDFATDSDRLLSERRIFGGADCRGGPPRDGSDFGEVEVDEEGREMKAPTGPPGGRFRLTTSPVGGVVCLGNGARGGGRFAASLTPSDTRLRGMLRAGALLLTLADACKAPRGVPVRAAEEMPNG